MAIVTNGRSRKRGRPTKGVTNALYESAVEGNLGARVFYLQNRDRDNWQDRFDYKVETDLCQMHLAAMEQLMRGHQAAVIDVTPNHPALEVEPND